MFPRERAILHGARSPPATRSAPAGHEADPAARRGAAAASARQAASRARVRTDAGIMMLLVGLHGWGKGARCKARSPPEARVAWWRVADGALAGRHRPGRDCSCCPAPTCTTDPPTAPTGTNHAPAGWAAHPPRGRVGAGISFVACCGGAQAVHSRGGVGSQIVILLHGFVRGPGRRSRVCLRRLRPRARGGNVRITRVNSLCVRPRRPGAPGKSVRHH